MGNNEFKQGNYHAAIEYYSDAIEIQPHETIFSNRAASFIAIKEFRRAMEDCQQAVRLNPDFARTYKRLFKAHMALGNVQEANEALQIAIQKEPNDAANKADSKLMEDVLYAQRMITKFSGEEE
jgi:tetratricopeptide (TPR) repeat protein